MIYRRWFASKSDDKSENVLVKWNDDTLDANVWASLLLCRDIRCQKIFSTFLHSSFQCSRVFWFITFVFLKVRARYSVEKIFFFRPDREWKFRDILCNWVWFFFDSLENRIDSSPVARNIFPPSGWIGHRSECPKWSFRVMWEKWKSFFGTYRSSECCKCFGRFLTISAHRLDRSKMYRNPYEFCEQN